MMTAVLPSMAARVPGYFTSAFAFPFSRFLRPSVITAIASPS